MSIFCKYRSPDNLYRSSQYSNYRALLRLPYFCTNRICTLRLCNMDTTYSHLPLFYKHITITKFNQTNLTIKNSEVFYNPFRLCNIHNFLLKNRLCRKYNDRFPQKLHMLSVRRATQTPTHRRTIKILISNNLKPFLLILFSDSFFFLFSPEYNWQRRKFFLAFLVKRIMIICICIINTIFHTKYPSNYISV